MKNNYKIGSSTMIALCFLTLLSFILLLQINNYKNELWIDNQLINHYERQIKQLDKYNYY